VTETLGSFLGRAESRLLDLSVEANLADWVYATYITPDSEAISAKSYSRLIGTTVAFAKESTLVPSQGASADEQRRAKLLRLMLPLIAPSDPTESEELTRRVATMQGYYSRFRASVPGTPEPLDVQGLSRLLAENRDPATLERAFLGWHAVGRGIRGDFARYVDLANRGARELGFADTGAMWRSKYDMEADAFVTEVTRLWEQVRPLYRSLHAYVRHRLVERYGADRVPPAGPIPAQFLGNMWAQAWDEIYDLLAPPGVPAGTDLTKLLLDHGTTPIDMVRYAERFFVSLGLDPMPSTFWERSMFVRPRDREVVCHASAWDLDFEHDLRIKMCIEVTGDDFRTIHHELGHNYYQRAYAAQPFLYRDSAHDGFHEAIGDTIALSVTPGYLHEIGLLADLPDEGDVPPLLRMALQKIAFLPFGLLVDRWRWDVFSGAVRASEYNASWWKLREEYQGIRPPEARTERDFDAGAKYHVPANVPYMRYFLAHILQFQFHRGLYRAIGGTGPLHRFSIYGSKDAGRRLEEMLAMGQSRPWPEALEALTGERRMDAAALLEYFAPLQAWLDEQNRGHPVGW